MCAEYTKANEGFKPYIYFDSQGYKTFGIGHKIESSAEEEKINSMSESDRVAYAQELFEIDYAKARENASKYDWFSSLNSGRQDVIVDMMFQLGNANFADFKKMIAAISKGDFDTAAYEMLDSLYENQAPTRAKNNADRMKNGY